MAIRFANNFNKPLAAGCTSGALTISLSGANATALQTAIGGALGADYLFATLVDASNNIEIIKITAINTGTGALTVQRGQDLTTARAWLSGDILSVRPNRQALLDVNVGKANSGANTDITSLANCTSITGFGSLSADSTWTGSQRGAFVAENDLSIDLNASNNFTCTTSTSATLTFTNRIAGQSGWIKFVITGAPTISAHANTKISTTNLAKLGVAGTYVGSYFCDGTDVYVSLGVYA
jgi:hypothetical protein